MIQNKKIDPPPFNDILMFCPLRHSVSEASRIPECCWGGKLGQARKAKVYD